MKQPWLLKLVLVLLAAARACQAQQEGPWDIRGRDSRSEFGIEGTTNYVLNGGVYSNQAMVITFDKGANYTTRDEIWCEGDVTILDHGHIWRGTNFIYNTKTGDVRAGWFKTMQPPYSIEGRRMAGVSNRVQTATNAIVSTDDYQKPFFTLHARTMTIAPGDYIEAHQATLYVGKMPIFYWPYYRRSLKPHRNNFEFSPGDRGMFGPYLLSAFNWYGTGLLDGTIHFDERERRGMAGGPDLALHLTNWGEASFRYYYAHDTDPQADDIPAPHLDRDRQRAQFFYDVYPTSNVTARVVANYQSDPLIIRDFYQSEYQANVEPASFGEVNDLWHNWVLDAMVQPRLVNFFETVERLPDIKLNGLRQEVGDTPIYYESESSVGYFERAFSNTNTPWTNDYSAGRADTFHQFSMPETFFGWLNVTPVVGGRATYYSDVEGTQIKTNQQGRGIFNTGVDVSFKASRVYPNVQSDLLDMNGLRHIIEPEIDYAYIPTASSHVPLFDYQAPSLRLAPIDFPDYNSIDSIAQENVVRLMLRNKWQTKRRDGIEDVVNLAVYADWNLNPGTNNSFSDLYGDLDFRPRSWISFISSTRYDLAEMRWREALERVFIQPPGTALSLSFGYYYLLNDDPEFQTYAGEDLPGHNLFDFSLYYRMNENWSAHIAERFEAQNGVLQMQAYSLVRDLRSWTAALVFEVNQTEGLPTDFDVLVTFSFKASPRYKLNGDNDQFGQLIPSASTPNLQDIY